MSCHLMSCHSMTCHSMSCHSMSCHSMSCHLMSCHSMSDELPLNELPFNELSFKMLSLNELSLYELSVNVLSPGMSGWCEWYLFNGTVRYYHLLNCIQIFTVSVISKFWIYPTKRSLFGNYRCRNYHFTVQFYSLITRFWTFNQVTDGSRR